MHTFIFLVLIKNINGGGSFGNTGECIEVKTNEPLNNVMETLNGGGQ